MPQVSSALLPLLTACCLHHSRVLEPFSLLRLHSNERCMQHGTNGVNASCNNVNVDSEVRTFQVQVPPQVVSPPRHLCLHFVTACLDPSSTSDVMFLQTCPHYSYYYYYYYLLLLLRLLEIIVLLCAPYCWKFVCNFFLPPTAASAAPAYDASVERHQPSTSATRQRNVLAEAHRNKSKWFAIRT
jgi:hypothetical protein